MKSKNNRIIFYLRKSILTLIVMFLFACNESEFLQETPLDFYSPENSFVTYENFNAGVNNLYYRFRDYFYDSPNAYRVPRILLWTTDLIHYNQPVPQLPNYSAIFIPSADFIYTAVWQPCYHLIYDSNVLIGRADGEQSELTEEQKILVKAEASFFRGYAYKMLANLYGGVPLVLEETSEPRRDYTRASREEVYQQALSDLKFAAENLKGIDEVEGSRISDLVAYHVLSEVYISLNMWDEAINAASKTIDHPSTALMTERFGSRVNDVYNPNWPWVSGGDAYWDLFRKGNQNRSSGNKEALWVMQYEYNVPGGGGGGMELERIYNARLWTANIYNNDGSRSRITPYPNTYYGGRSGGFMRLSNFFYHELWQRSGYDEDLRNADYNIIRDLKVNNPASDYNGKWIIQDNVPIDLKNFTDTVRNFYPLLAKTSSLGDHPDDVFIADQTVEGSITSATGPSYVCHRDVYHIRLAETYLLRAEAYLGKGDKTNAANDINVVRRRSQAPDVSSDEVDIDYILDERLRELYT
ncbi:MAG: RagB/SusD family nutrient uptake outer membrane protein, partial [Bacteroidales bacterium]